MTDKDKMQEEFEPDPIGNFTEGQWWVLELDNLQNKTTEQTRAVAVVHHMLSAISHSKAAKESNRKELLVVQAERDAAFENSRQASKELEAAKQRIAEYQAHNVKVQNLLWDKDEEKESLEKKLAEQQSVMVRMGYVGRFNGTEELTKREAAARQQGFEEGKQAGRDEVLKELSEQEPVAYNYALIGEGQIINSITPSYKIASPFGIAGKDFSSEFEVETIELIPRPLPPVTKE